MKVNDLFDEDPFQKIDPSKFKLADRLIYYRRNLHSVESRLRTIRRWYENRTHWSYKGPGDVGLLFKASSDARLFTANIDPSIVLKVVTVTDCSMTLAERKKRSALLYIPNIPANDKLKAKTKRLQAKVFELESRLPKLNANVTRLERQMNAEVKKYL